MYSQDSVGAVTLKKDNFFPIESGHFIYLTIYYIYYIYITTWRNLYRKKGFFNLLQYDGILKNILKKRQVPATYYLTVKKQENNFQNRKT